MISCLPLQFYSFWLDIGKELSYSSRASLFLKCRVFPALYCVWVECLEGERNYVVECIKTRWKADHCIFSNLPSIDKQVVVPRLDRGNLMNAIAWGKIPAASHRCINPIGRDGLCQGVTLRMDLPVPRLGEHALNGFDAVKVRERRWGCLSLFGCCFMRCCAVGTQLL